MKVSCNLMKIFCVNLVKIFGRLFKTVHQSLIVIKWYLTPQFELENQQLTLKKSLLW